CIPLEESNQKIFAFEWENSNTGRKTQLCWTMLPQGFKNSLTLFGNILAKELEKCQGKNSSVTLLQYVDDILLGIKTESECKLATVDLLNFLGLAGYRVSLKKAQLVQETVIYLGFEISHGKR
ncbi:PO113 protein, partial [Nothocercus nigrocapillus]|nr:PO113 protein [Nothocercus nigrocapillus]